MKEKVAIIRLSKSFTKEIPPCSGWPFALKSIIYGYHGFVDGGLHVHGEEEAAVTDDQVIRECLAIKDLGINSVVVCGVYSPIDVEARQENRVRDIALKYLPGVDVVCSHEVANLGFMERENAAILNASILKFARRTVAGFQSVISRLGLSCNLFLTQNDGTLVDMSQAAHLPIRTFLSGPTNSIAGAGYLGLSGSNSNSPAVVIDIGGTTTDVGVLLPSGVPRQASAYSTIAGVRVNYGMPHLETLGLGGGSRIRFNGLDNTCTVGPDSVGSGLVQEALTFGGSVLTATDIAVASQCIDLGDRHLVEGKVDQNILEEATKLIDRRFSAALDLVKTSSEPLPVLLVGGGAIIAPKDLRGASEVVRPPFYDVANAIGAAIAKVGATVDIIKDTSHLSSAEAIEQVKEEAIKTVLREGATHGTTRIVSIDVLPLQYMANKLRIVVRAAGELSDTYVQQKLPEFESTEGHEAAGTDESQQVGALSTSIGESSTLEDAKTYIPRVVRNATGIPEWHISATDLSYLADGCYILGCAGGGSPTSTVTLLKNLLAQGYTMRVVDASSIRDDAVIMWGGHMGSPAVSVERLAGTETIDAFHELLDYLRLDSFDAIVALEIGGANGMESLLAGCSKYFDRPAIDADFMGRAYPTYHQTTLAVHCPGELVPCAIASGEGKNLVMTKTTNDESVDRVLRASCAEMGCRVGMAARPTSTQKVRNFAVMNTMSLAWRIGRCIALAEEEGRLGSVPERVVEAVGGEKTARVLFRGKITAVEQRLFKGHSYGEITIVPLSDDETEMRPITQKDDAAIAEGGTLRIPYKNENILVEHIAQDGSQQYLATVPDLIAVLDMQSGRAIGVPEYRYGLRVTVIGITGSPRWTDSDRGLIIGGPRAFGHDIDYKAIGVYIEPKSVIEEFLAGS